MEQKRIVYQVEGGGLAVVIPAPGAALDEVMWAVPPGAACRVVEAAEIPAARVWRDAWEFDPEGPGLVVNRDKARAILHGIRRDARAAEFAPLDSQVTIHVAQPEKLAEVEARRQLVRDWYADLQTRIDGAESVADLDGLLQVLAGRS